MVQKHWWVQAEVLRCHLGGIDPKTSGQTEHEASPQGASGSPPWGLLPWEAASARTPPVSRLGGVRGAARRYLKSPPQGIRDPHCSPSPPAQHPPAWLHLPPLPALPSKQVTVTASDASKEPNPLFRPMLYMRSLPQPSEASLCWLPGHFRARLNTRGWTGRRMGTCQL